MRAKRICKSLTCIGIEFVSVGVIPEHVLLAKLAYATGRLLEVRIFSRAIREELSPLPNKSSGLGKIRMYRKYTKENLQPVITASFSFRQVLDKLGLRHTGGSHSHLKNLVKRFEIDTSHFLGQGWMRGKRGRTKTSDEVLVLRPDHSREKTHKLRRAMIDAGFKEECECGQGKEWNGKKLVLEIDHVNGNAWDNRPENLRFICPNCHSQRATIPTAEETGRELVQ